MPQSSRIQQIVLIWAFLAILSVTAEEAFPAEIRTYQFESGGYTSSCGECSGPFSVEAGIAGSFTVAIDYPNQSGALLDVSAQLSEPHELIGEIVVVDGVQQFSFERVPIPIESFNSEVNLDWKLGDFGWEGFLSVDDGIVELTSRRPTGEEDDSPLRYLPPGYTVVMGQNEATLSISHEAIDYSFGIIILEAANVVPAPSTFALAALVLPFFIFHRRAAT